MSSIANSTDCNVYQVNNKWFKSFYSHASVGSYKCIYTVNRLSKLRGLNSHTLQKLNTAPGITQTKRQIGNSERHDDRQVSRQMSNNLILFESHKVIIL